MPSAQNPPHGAGAGQRGSLTQEQLAVVVSIASDAIIAVDADEHIIFFNDGAENIFGYVAGQVLGQPLSLLLPERFRAAHSEHVRTFAAGAEHARQMGHRRQIYGLRSDGTEFPAEASIAKATDRQGRHYLVVLRDVTEQQQRREDLLEQQRLLREAQAIAHVGSWEWVVGADRVHWSEELHRIYGIEPGSIELSLETFLERVLDEDRATTMAHVQRSLDTAEPFDFEERIRRPGGSIRLLRSRGTVEVDEQGRPRRLLGVCQDITEQRAAEEAALALARETAAREAAVAAEARMTLLATASAELASSLDYETTLRTVARLAVPTLADWAAIDIIDGGTLRRVAVEHTDPQRVSLAIELSERYPPDPDAPRGAWHVVRTGRTELMSDITDEMIESAAQDEEHLRLIRDLGLRSYVAAPLISHSRVLGSLVLIHAESGRRYTEADLPFIEDLARRAANAIENARLVTELRDAQSLLQEQAQEMEVQADEMERQNIALQRTDRAKSDFMATVSHELRTPLNAIIGYTELLRDGVPVSIPEPARQQVERIQLGARHLLQLIEEILTFSSLEAGRQQVSIADVDTAALLAELNAIVEPLAERQGLHFIMRSNGVPPTLRSDPTKLRQILLNLLSNAVKFTDNGSVELDVGTSAGQIVFVVRDTGIGVRTEDRDLLFEPFWQADQSLTRQVQGAGLGLAIAQRFTQLLGGSIEVSSRPGAGSEFTVRLPLRPDAQTGADY